MGVGLTPFFKSNCSRGLDPVRVGVSISSICPVEMGDSSDASRTKPSRNAYSASKNALAILCISIGFMAFCLLDFEDPEGRSAPTAILNAAVVTCR